MKKILSIILVLCLALSLVACGKSQENTQSAGEDITETSAGTSKTTETSETEKPVTITLATSLYVEEPHQAAIDKLIEAYKKIKPNVTVEIYGAGYADYWDNITTEIMAGNEADITHMYSENIATYHDLRPEGVFEDLTPYMKGKGLEEKMTGQELCTYKDQILALSNYAYGTTGLFYRKSMLEEAGIDPESIRTWDDFYEASKKLTHGNQYAMGILTSSHAFVVSEWCRQLARVVSGGLYFPNGESGPYTADRINVNSPENLWAAEQWQKYLLVDKLGKPAPDKKDAREYFWNGICAFCHDGPWFIGMTESSYPEVMDDMGLIPNFDVVYNGKTYKPNPTNYVVVSCLSKNCENKDEAWSFMEWMTTEEAAKIIQDCGMIPSNKEYASSEEYTSTHELAGIFNSFLDDRYTTLVSDPSIPQLGELNQIMIDACQEMFSGGKDCKTVLDKAAEKCKEVMNK